MRVTIYTKGYCGFCFAAKNLLTKRGIAYEEIPVSSIAEEMEMRELTGGRTVPQILIDGESVGGYEQLVELDRDGRLQNHSDPTA